MDKTPYHHGDLRNALLDTARGVVERDGAEALSLRSLAEDLGVSRAAPYRHFADRDALLAEIAASGFEDHVAAYQAFLDTDMDGRDRIALTTRFYLDYAARRPGLHRLMFESDLLARTPPPAVLIPPADRSYRLLVEIVRQAFPGESEDATLARAITAISTTIGFLTLRGAGRFKPFMRGGLSDADIEAAIIAAVSNQSAAAPLAVGSICAPSTPGSQ